MLVLPTLAQTVYFYGAIAAFLTMGVTIAYGMIATWTLPSAEKTSARVHGLSQAHAH